MQESAGDAALTPAQREAARAGWKALMPIGGRPFVEWGLDVLADAGCTDVALVIGDTPRSAFQELARSGRVRRTRVSLVVQARALGTADAVAACAQWVGDEPFLVVNGDNLYPSAALRALIGLDRPGLAVFDAEDLMASSNIPEARLAEFALVQITSCGELAAIVEKPAHQGGPRLVSMNAWRFDRRIFEACRAIPLSDRGEYELPAAVTLAILRGVRFACVRASGPVLDLSRSSDVAEVTRRLIGSRPQA